MADLLNDRTGNPIQAFPLTYGKVGITTGTITGIGLFHCVVDGDITITFPSGDVTVSCVAGDDYACGPANSVTVVSGTFHLA